VEQRTLIRPMTAEDVPSAGAMIERGGWGDRRAFLRWAIEHAEARPLVCEVDGAIVASGLGTISGRVGWLGAIFVDATRRRQGYGRALTEAICEALEASGARTLALVASRMGAPLYETLGFRETTRYHTYEAAGTNAPIAARGLAVRPFDALRDLAAASSLDASATGEDRSHLLRAWARPDAAIVVEDAAGVVHGFVVRPPFGGGATIADSPAAALALLEHRRRVVGPQRHVRAGIPSENAAGRSMLSAAGWEEAWIAPRMERGEPIGWHPDQIFGQFGMAVG
jgi:predicted N-acetyltransferase YhbS